MTGSSRAPGLGIPGVKTQILTQFRPVNRDEYNEEKIRAWKQGAEEPAKEYFYDVLDLCRRVNPRMAEDDKVRCLWRGLKPSVIEKLWSLKPPTHDGFFGRNEKNRGAHVME